MTRTFGRTLRSTRQITYGLSLQFYVGLIGLLTLLLTAFGRTNHAFYPKHDFLDHVVTLNSIWAKESTFMGHLVALPRVLNGTVPAGALGISDFSIPHRLYALLPIDVALGVSEILGRTLAYVIAYLFILFLLGSDLPARWAGVVAGLSFALMPYLPNLTWTITALALCLLALLKLQRLDEKVTLWLVALMVSPHLAYFAWGGFLQPITAACILVIAFMRSRITAFLAIGVVINLLSSMLSALGLIRVLSSATFVSHREDWPRLKVFEPGALTAALRMYPQNFLEGDYQYGTFFSFDGARPFRAFGIVAILLVLAGSVFLGGTSWLRRAERGQLRLVDLPYNLRRPGSLLFTLIAVQSVITFVYVSEASGFTQLVTAFPVPFQISRVIAFAPLFWALIAGICLYFLFLTVPAEKAKVCGGVAVTCIILFTAIVHPSISNALRSTFGIHPQASVSTFDGYFKSETYRRILKMLESEGISPITLSLGLDPMVSVQNGFTALDGYVYNYPLNYKRQFSTIVNADLSEPEGRLSYFRDWGSRVYLFDRGVPSIDLKFNWCAAASLGAEVLLSARSLPDINSLELLGKVEEIFIYRIVKPCTRS